MGSDAPGEEMKAAGILVQRQLEKASSGLTEWAGWFCRLIWRCRLAWAHFDVEEPRDAHELLEVLGNELGAVVGDDARLLAGKLLQGALDDDFDVGLGHPLAQLMVDDEADTAVEQGAKVVERPGDMDGGTKRNKIALAK